MPIEQAKGFVARALGVDMDAARDLLRGYARRHQLRLSEVARAVAREELELRALLERGRS
ncbi:hypothetical protein QE381_002850 [Microbacterium sp. SORGH_AS 888]|nr:hypothetical protein [Microbacterium sp. SORGH_AS_0888]